MKIMKKQSIYALMSAIALAGAVGLSACSSSKDDVGEVSPNFNPNTNEALVEFVFNVAPGANHASTRQTADATQAYALTAMTGDKFRGIEDAHVMCFMGGDDGKFLVTPAIAERDFDMARVAASNSLNKDKSTRVLEMSLPINTNKMVFYGRAISPKLAIPTEITDEYINNLITNKGSYGHLDEGTNGYNIDKDLSKTYFHLSKRLTDSDKTNIQLIERLLASILTCIMETDRGTVDATVDTEVLNGYHLNMKWSAYNTIDKTYPSGKSLDDPENDVLKPLEIKLGKIYKEMTSIQEAELRNGSAPALLATITDLWTIINGVRCATATNKQEALAKYMADRIHNELQRYFNGTVTNDGGPVTDVVFKSVSDLITALLADPYWPGTGVAALPTAEQNVFGPITSYSRLSDFPASFALPQGATHLKFNKSGNTDASRPNYIPENAFYYAVDFNSSAAGGGSFSVDDYYYPAELLYFGNSPLRVSDATYKASEYPQTTALWDATGDGTFWKTVKDGHSWALGSHVKTSTRSVAMANDINYGTALLEMTVGYVSTGDNAISSTNPLQDNNHYIQNRDYGVTEENNKIVPKDGDFKLVGVLIGGQYPRVGWNFLPKLQDGERQGYIYDNIIAGGGSIPAPGNTTTPNYTLVFDNLNYNPSNGAIETTQNTVYVALELENNTGSGFFGKDNLIPNGSHFYLIGALDPAAGQDLTSPAHHALPPYNANGTLNNVKRVFVQDHKTTVNFKIGEFSLQYAYLNIPDLRSSSVTLGLSVDLSWSTGINFGEVVIGGNTQYTGQ